MKRIWAKVLFLVVGVLSFLGFDPSWAVQTPPSQPFGEVKENTPLYLKLGFDRVVQGETDTHLAYWRHYQHYSHRAHKSHWAHYSHYAHRSHYNYYRR